MKKTLVSVMLIALLAALLLSACGSPAVFNVSSNEDNTISVTAEEDLLRARLIDRKIKTGVAEKAAVRFVDFSDMQNVRLCLEKSRRADLALRIDETGDYFLKA